MIDAAISYPASILDRCALFQSLGTADRLELLAHAHRRKYAAGEPIFHVASPGDSMMAILLGTVRISLPTVTGKDIILADMPAGEVFGEIALLDGRGRSADAAALTKVELLVIERRHALQFLKRHPELCLRMLELVCAKLRISDERMSDIAFYDLGARLAKVILKRLPPHGAGRARLSLSQGELARMISGTREAVNRELRAWQKRGIVGLADGWIVVERRADLAAIAGAD